MNTVVAGHYRWTSLVWAAVLLLYFVWVYGVLRDCPIAQSGLISCTPTPTLVPLVGVPVIVALGFLRLDTWTTTVVRSIGCVVELALVVETFLGGTESFTRSFGVISLLVMLPLLLMSLGKGEKKWGIALLGLLIVCGAYGLLSTWVLL